MGEIKHMKPICDSRYCYKLATWTGKKKTFFGLVTIYTKYYCNDHILFYSVCDDLKKERIK